MRRAATVEPLNLPERDVTKQVTDYLKARGWQLIRLHTGTVRKRTSFINLGKKGRPDWLAVHPQIPAFYVEMKRNRGGVISDEQAAEIANLIRLGYKVAVPFSVQEFLAWYRREIETRAA